MVARFESQGNGQDDTDKGLSEQELSEQPLTLEELPPGSIQIIQNLRGRGNVGVAIKGLVLKDDDNIYYYGRKVDITGIDDVHAEGAAKVITEEGDAILLGVTSSSTSRISKNRPKPRSKKIKKKKSPPSIEFGSLEGEVSIDDLPLKAQSYIRNHLKMGIDIELTVEGKKLIVKEKQASYGGKIVILDSKEKRTQRYRDLPSWVKQAIDTAIKTGRGVISSRSGDRLEIDFSSGEINVKFNQVKVVGIPKE